MTRVCVHGAGLLHGPASFGDLMLTYKAAESLPELLERHITELAEADVILRLQVRSHDILFGSLC